MGEVKIMKQFYRLLTIIIILTLLLPLCSLFHQNKSKVCSIQPRKTIIKADLPISITGNAELNATASAGNGTPSNPYIIENRVIDLTGLTTHGISIQHTNAHFILRNCIITNGAMNYVGIRLWNVSNGRILDNILEKNYYGIFLDDRCKNNLLLNNRANNNSQAGIALRASNNNNTLFNNTANHNYYGIHFELANNNNLTQNIANYNRWGIFFYASDYNILINNTANFNTPGKSAFERGRGFHLYQSNFNLLINNTFSYNRGKYPQDEFLQADGSGIILESAYNNTFISNTVNNNDFYGCWFMEQTYNNTLFKNTIDNNGMHGIWLGATTTTNFIKNNTLYGGIDGIYLESSNNSISDNILSDMQRSGILLHNTENNEIHNNRFFKNGILVEGENLSNFIHEITPDNTLNNYPIYYYKHSTNLTVVDDLGQLMLVNCSRFQILFCNISHGTLGIALFFSPQNNISFNILNGNNLNGIKLWNSHNNTCYMNTIIGNKEDAMMIAHSNYNILMENNASCNKNGFYLLSSNYNKIINNTINANSLYGIYLESSNYSTVKWNWLVDNLNCWFESPNCIGNIFEENTCQNRGGGIPGFNWIYIFLDLFIIIPPIVIHRKKRNSELPIT